MGTGSARSRHASSPQLEIPILEWMEAAIPYRPLQPIDERSRVLISERMAWIDRNAFRHMVGVYYGTNPFQAYRRKHRG